MDDQAATLAFLADPASYGAPSVAVKRIDTHLSAVFLAGDLAYKLKRAVTLPFVDFATLEKRHAACAAELAVNRRTASDLYLDIRAIRKIGDRLAFDGDGDIVDWVVVMRRFPDDALWDARAAAGRIAPDDVRDLADAIASFHAAAEIVPTHGSVADLDWTRAGNAVDLVRFFDPAACAALDAATAAQIAAHAGLIAARAADGHVRRCHGDLHLRNITTLAGKPVPFDAIEFDDRISCIDTLYDIAFLLVDWLRVGRADFAAQTLSRYLQRRPDEAGLVLLPLFMSLRAAVKAKTRAMASAHEEAQSCFDMAARFLSPPPARLIAVGGLSGTGKSVLAAALAPSVGAAPGALVLRSDVERKRLAGLAPEVKLPKSAYATEASAAVYASLHSRARTALDAGHSVIVDAVYADAAERADVAALAPPGGFCGLWLDCPEPVRLARVGARAGDASDADADVVRFQSGLAADGGDWVRIDAGGSPEQTLAAVLLRQVK
ncbi:MAG: AAA family ATPase [Telmatospirillum sp.]|nr:AAA family ATPase [Telmatospirillum sp.]